MPRDKYNPGLRGVSSLATSVSWSRVGRRTLSTPQSLAQERMVKPCWQGQLAPLGIYWKMDQDLTSCQPHRCEAVVLGQGDQADEMVKSHTLSWGGVMPLSRRPEMATLVTTPGRCIQHLATCFLPIPTASVMITHDGQDCPYCSLS